MRIQLALLFLFFTPSLLAQKVERVEPPNWWVGMKHSEIQLLVYGENISTLRPAVASESIAMTRVVSVENPNYLFLNLVIKDSALPGKYPINFYKGKKVIDTYTFNLLERENGRAEIKGFTTEDVLYLITPDRFANGDESNDSVKGMKEVANRSSKLGRHGGDIKGMQDRLGYLNEMGFTAIWINPIIENDMFDYSYHGYAATDFYQVDRRYGSNEEYRDLCKEAGSMGIKIIMDMIMNHAGSEHWFVKDPPTSDWINYQDNFVQTSHRRNVNQDIHASEYDKKSFSDGWFVKTMPDLNQRNKIMAQYLIQNTLWWIEYTGISGIRMDTYPYPDKFFMADWTCAVMEEYPNFNIVGEEWTTNPAIVSYWQKGKVNHDGYTSCLPSLMDFPLQDAVINSLIEEEKQYGSGMIKAYEALSMDFLYPDPNQLVVFPDNHDMARFYTQLEGDFDLFKMGMIYFATVRGVPQFYYGTEVLMNSDEDRDDHGTIRGDFPGGWQGDIVDAFTGQGLSEDQKAAQKFTKLLLNWRKTSKAVHDGRLIQFSPENGIYAFFRITESEKVMVVFNKNDETIDLTFDKFAEVLTGHKQATDVLGGKNVSISQPLNLAAKSAVILQIE